MSRTRALNALFLQPTDRVPIFEHLQHPELMRKLTGIDPWDDPTRAMVETYRALDMDMIGGVILPENGAKPGTRRRRVRNGEVVEEAETARTAWGIASSEWTTQYCVKNEEEVLAYDPAAADSPDGLRPAEEVAEEFRERCRRQNAAIGEVCYFIPDYYTTLFQWPIMTFGWELFLMAASSEPDAFDRIWDGFFQVSLRNMEAWSLVGVEAMLIHDDLAWTDRLVFPPEWYREKVFPRYEALFERLKRVGTKILFVSDGNINPLLDDLVAVGVDGFVVEYMVDMEYLAHTYGDRLILAGNASPAVLTLGSPEGVEAEVKRCLDLAKACPGYFLNTGGGIPHNIPLENVEAYFAAYQRHASRVL